jgi:hypothetical protein
MDNGKGKNKHIGNDGTKRSIQRSTSEKRLSKWPQKEKTVYKKISRGCNIRYFNTWTSRRR